MHITQDFCDPFFGNGRVVYRSRDKVVWMAEVYGETVTCVQQRVDQIVEDNKEALNNSAGKRFGDGRVVASIPLDIYYNKLVPAKKNGDDAYIKRFLNDSDNRAFRRFGGNI